MANEYKKEPLFSSRMILVRDVPGDLHAALHMWAKSDNTTLQQLVIRILREAAEKRGFYPVQVAGKKLSPAIRATLDGLRDLEAEARRFLGREPTPEELWKLLEGELQRPDAEEKEKK